MSRGARVRRALLANPPVQGIALRRLAFYWLAYHLVLWLSLFLYRYYQYRTNLLAGGEAISLADLYGRFTRDHYPVIVCAVAILPLLVWDVWHLTQRVLGPLVRFRHCLKLLARGESVSEIRLRRGDLLAEMQDAFNEFLASPYNPGRSVAAGMAPAHSTQTVESAPPGNTEERAAVNILTTAREIQSSFFRTCEADGTPRPVPLPTAPQTAPAWWND